MCHVSSGEFPQGSFIRGDKELVVSSPELCFLQMASELNFVDLIKLGYEFCGNYRLDKLSEPEQGFRKDIPLTSVAALKFYLNKAAGLKGRKNASKALRYIADGAASPMEPVLAMMLTLPYRLGGYGFEMPRLNYPIEIGPKTQLSRSKITYYGDLYWPGARVDIEYDSDAFHSTPDRIAADSIRRTTLNSTGVTVITVSRKQIISNSRMREVAKVLSKKLGKRLQPPMPEFTTRNLRLLKQLLP